MLFLLFQLGKDRYALPASKVVEVLPLVELKRIPNHRGRPVPAIDLSELTIGQPAGERLSTRIIMINYPDDQGRNRPLGLIAERVTETIQRETSDFTEPGMRLSDAPYLGPVLMDGKGCIQWLYEQRLLSDRVRDLLFCETLEQS
jgi:chemotaxis-related protein WspB